MKPGQDGSKLERGGRKGTGHRRRTQCELHVAEIQDQVDAMLTSLDLGHGRHRSCLQECLPLSYLYNLNNINITERRRELATLKVLGFYDLEK